MPNISITKETFFNNGQIMLPYLKDGVGSSLETAIRTAVTGAYPLTPKTRTKGPGYDAKEFNKTIRGLMSGIPGIHLETHVEYDSFVHYGINGFDFSFYDEAHNQANLRNYFIGNPGIYDGENKLRALKKNVTGMNKVPWNAQVNTWMPSAGTDLTPTKNMLSVVGEIQVGNWALIKHDLLRLLNSSNTVDIDYYIYITVTGNLENALSDGIVTYDSAVEAIKENATLLKTPMWVIGLDY